MKFKTTFYCLLICFSLTFLTGCFTTKRVTAFSKASIEGLESSKNINYSFTQYCITKYENVQDDNIVEDIPVDLSTPNYNSCTATDNARKKIYTTILAYFNALQELSDEKLLGYRIDTITATLTPGNYTGISVDSSAVKSVNNIGNKLLAASTGVYRNQKLKKFIKEADVPISNLLEVLRKFYALLVIEVESEKTSSSYYLKIVKGDLRQKNAKTGQEEAVTVTATERIKALHNYINKMAELDKDKVQITKFMATLDGIKQSHHDVALKIDNISNEELKKLLLNKSAILSRLINDFKTT